MDSRVAVNGSLVVDTDTPVIRPAVSGSESPPSSARSTGASAGHLDNSATKSATVSVDFFGARSAVLMLALAQLAQDVHHGQVADNDGVLADRGGNLGGFGESFEFALLDHFLGDLLCVGHGVLLLGRYLNLLADTHCSAVVNLVHNFGTTM